MSVYYNEYDAFAAGWLRELISAGLLPRGDVDERDIRDVHPADIDGYRQCHFFAGIGGWPLALQLASWPVDHPVWTGSCPCQPFSAAGRGGGFADERHLWPAFFHLIGECRPAIVFGEQVASKDGLGWLDLVQTDLEGAGYAVGAADLCAAGVGAPHVRQRLWWVADADGERAAPSRLERRSVMVVTEPSSESFTRDSSDGELGDAGREGRRQVSTDAERRSSGSSTQGLAERSVDQLACSPWFDVEWLPCRDGKTRSTQPGLQPLAHGIPNRVGTLRGAGNAIVSQVAEEFIRAYMSIR